MRKLTDSETADLSELIEQLHSRNGVERGRARKEIIQAGHKAVPDLLSLLDEKSLQVRWEAVKALGQIADPSTAQALVGLLTDKSPEIRWLAAEGLIALKRQSLQPLFERLIDDFSSSVYRQGVHHVLHVLELEGALNRQEIKLLDVLRSIEREDEIAPETYKALEQL